MPTSRQRAAAALILALVLDDEPDDHRVKRNRKTWVKGWRLGRQKYSCYYTLLQELHQEDRPGYRKWLWMTYEAFHDVLEHIKDGIQKRNTVMRDAIPAEERLAVTLRYLATGESFTSLAYSFQLGESTVSMIVLDTCHVIYMRLKADYLCVPNSVDAWTSIAERFSDLWQFPHCVGAINGKHVHIRPPPAAGSEYYNYKGQHSVVLLALVDADLCFTYVDVGTNGRISDRGVFNKSTLYAALQEDRLHIPPPTPVAPGMTPLPHIIVADDAFALTRYIMKPYPGANLTESMRIFNYRLSRARRCSENAFGILASRWRVFQSDIPLHPEKVKWIVFASCALHNYLRRTARMSYTPPGAVDYEDRDTGSMVPGAWRHEGVTNNMTQIHPGGSNHSSSSAREIRDGFCTYFMSDNGSVPWQWERARFHPHP